MVVSLIFCFPFLKERIKQHSLIFRFGMCFFLSINFFEIYCQFEWFPISSACEPRFHIQMIKSSGLTWSIIGLKSTYHSDERARTLNWDLACQYIRNIPQYFAVNGPQAFYSFISLFQFILTDIFNFTLRNNFTELFCSLPSLLHSQLWEHHQFHSFKQIFKAFRKFWTCPKSNPISCLPQPHYFNTIKRFNIHLIHPSKQNKQKTKNKGFKQWY